MSIASTFFFVSSDPGEQKLLSPFVVAKVYTKTYEFIPLDTFVIEPMYARPPPRVITNV